MCRKVYLKAKEAEMEMQEARNAEGFVGKTEKLLIANMVKAAKNNSRIGDKLLMVVDPKQIHIPDWQRRIKLARAYEIGNNYNSYKWDEPKVLLFNGILLCVDGQHRIFGAFKANKEDVVVEVMECTLEEAIDLFLSQSTDRAKMQPMDIYKAALAAKKPEYVKLHDICAKHNVAVKGDDITDNTVGTLTSISDGVGFTKGNPELLDFRNRTESDYIPRCRLEELATLFKDGLISDDRDSALEYFDECCEMTEEEKSFFGIEEDSPIANTKFENPMYNKGYDDGFSDGANSKE